MRVPPHLAPFLLREAQRVVEGVGAVSPQLARANSQLALAQPSRRSTQGDQTALPHSVRHPDGAGIMWGVIKRTNREDGIIIREGEGEKLSPR